MHRRLLIAAAFSVGLVLAAHSRSIKPPHESLARSRIAVTPASTQPQSYEFVEHVIDQVRPCEGNPLQVSRNTAQAVYDFTFTSGTEAGCTAVTIPNGRITLNFPALFTAGVAFTPSINTTGTLQLRVASNHFTVSGKGLTVDSVIHRLPIREDPGVHQDLRNAPCPLARFRQNPPLNGGTEAVPGLNPFARDASCSVTSPIPFQSFEGNLVLIISTVDIVVGEGTTGPANFFDYRGIRVLRFTITSKYRPATTSCPGFQNGLNSPQDCPAALKIEAPTPIFASDDCTVTVSARKQDGSIDSSFNGSVEVSLASGFTEKIGCLKLGNQCASTLSVPLTNGTSNQNLKFQTPEQELNANSELKAGDPVLKGKARIKAVLGNLETTHDVDVESPLDLRVDRIEVQQGFKTERPEDFVGPWVQLRDLIIRVYVDANRQQFSKYKSISDITAKLTIRDQSGGQIEGSPFTLRYGGFDPRSDTPGEPFVFIPNSGPNAFGRESLNHVHRVTAQEDSLSLEAQLDPVYPDRNTTNNAQSLSALNFVTSKPFTVFYSHAIKPPVIGVTPPPDEAAIAREMEFVQLAYPVSLPLTRGLLRFVRVSPGVELLHEDPIQKAIANKNSWASWFNRKLGSTPAPRIYFVPSSYFVQVGTSDAGGKTYRAGSVAIVTDRCRGSDATFHCGILAHELGHIFGLGDTYSVFNFGIQRAQPNPAVNPRSGGDENGNPVGAGTYSWHHHRFALSPIDFYDFMGNAKPWTDRVNWNYLRTKFLPGAGSGLQFNINETERAAAEDYVIIQGQVGKNGTGELANCYTLTGVDLASPSSPGSYVIETLDGNGVAIQSLTFDPSYQISEDEVEQDTEGFSFALPFTAAVRQLRLRSGATTLATRQVSANAPVIAFTSNFSGQTLTGTRTVEWTGMDADGQPLTYSLFYTPDGQLQIPLSVETTATTYQWNTDDAPSGSTPKLTLTATDGVRTTIVESSSFSIPNRAPRMVILSPANQQQFKVGEPITFEGSLNDPEDGLFPRPSLSWSSDLQSSLGVGKRLILSNLTAGTHQIRVSGADLEGKIGESSITIIVRPDNFSSIDTTPGSVDFGTVTVGQARDLRVSVRNNGNAPLTVNALSVNNPQFRILTAAVPILVPARSQHDLTLRFTPVTAQPQNGTLTITSNASNQQALNLSLLGTASGPNAGSLTTVSAANFANAPVARDAIVSGFGLSLAGSTELAPMVPLPTQLAGTSVRVKDSTSREYLAPLFFVSPGQINYQIPGGAADGPATILVSTASGTFAIGEVTIVSVSPGIFTANSDGKGVPAGFLIRVKPDSSQIMEAVLRFDAGQNKFVPASIDFGPPADQLVLVLFGTGLRHRDSLSDVTCSIDGVPAQVGYAGEQGAFVGLDQINIGLPGSLAGRGEVDLVLSVAGQSNTVRVAFASTPPACDYAITPVSQSFNAAGGVGIVTVPAPAGCAWTAVSNASWLAITSGSAGTGPGSVNFFVNANSTSTHRTGTLTISGQTFTVTQAGASTATVLGRRTTLGPIPADCAPPDLKLSFLTTDQRMYQWTLVTGAHVGDQVRWEFAPVSGTFLQTVQHTVQFEGGLCFWAPLEIAGTPVSSITGPWQVKLFYNNVLLFTDNFTISAPFK